MSLPPYETSTLEETLISFGAVIDGPIAHSESVQRFHHIDDSAGSKNIWVRTFSDGGALYGWHKDGEDHHYQPRSERLSKKDYAIAKRKAQEAKRIQLAEKRIAENKAGQRAFERWTDASEVDPKHPYLINKGVKAFGLKQDEDALLMPLLDERGYLTSLQSITPKGHKLLLAGGRKKGSFHTISGEGETVFIVEGYSTGASVHMATGCIVLVAIDAGNIEHVLASQHSKYERIVVAADNDTGGANNTGLEAAKRAKKLFSIPYVLPQLNGEKVDWNDLHAARGLDEVLRQIKGGLSL